MTGFKESNEIAVYRLVLREITQRLRNNKRAPLTKLYKNFTESGRGN